MPARATLTVALMNSHTSSPRATSRARIASVRPCLPTLEGWERPTPLPHLVGRRLLIHTAWIQVPGMADHPISQVSDLREIGCGSGLRHCPAYARRRRVY